MKYYVKQELADMSCVKNGGKVRSKALREVKELVVGGVSSPWGTSATIMPHLWSQHGVWSKWSLNRFLLEQALNTPSPYQCPFRRPLMVGFLLVPYLKVLVTTLIWTSFEGEVTLANKRGLIAQTDQS